jgi:hypothetical protein
MLASDRHRAELYSLSALHTPHVLQCHRLAPMTQSLWFYVHRRSVFGASEARSVAHLLWPTLIRLHLDGPERSIHAVL